MQWILHRDPELHALDAHGRNVTVHLSHFNGAGLHKLFGTHFERVNVAPPSLMVRTWRRLFGWAYGLNDLEATLYHTIGAVVMLGVCYLLCFRYQAICDALQDV